MSKATVIAKIAEIQTAADALDTAVASAITAVGNITGGHGVDLNWAKVKREIAGMGNGPDALGYAVAALDSAESALATLVTAADTALDAVKTANDAVDVKIAAADAEADGLP